MGGISISKRIYGRALGHWALDAVPIEDNIQNQCTEFFLKLAPVRCGAVMPVRISQ